MLLFWEHVGFVGLESCDGGSEPEMSFLSLATVSVGVLLEMTFFCYVIFLHGGLDEVVKAGDQLLDEFIFSRRVGAVLKIGARKPCDIALLVECDGPARLLV